MRSADLRRLRGKADDAWRDVVRGEAERVLAIADPAERMRAYAQLSRVLAEEGETLPADAGDRILRSLQTDPPERLADQGKEPTMATWTQERRGMALMFTLRPIAAAGCAVAAVLPFALAAWRWNWSFGEAAAAFLTTGQGLAGVALAVTAAGIAGRMTARAETTEGLAGLLVAALAAGVVGLGVGLL